MNLITPEFSNIDNRRTLSQILTANIQQVNRYECQAGVTLGNHYHERTIEYFYVIKGKILIGNEFGKSVVNEGELYAVFPQESHIITTEGPATFLTFLTSPFDPKRPDLHKETNETKGFEVPEPTNIKS